MSNLLPRTTARIHDLTDGATWNTTDWRIVAALAHAAHQHAVNEAEFATAERTTRATGATSAQKRLDIAQRALRASQGILERLLEGGE